MDDRVSVELVHCGDDARLEFVFRCDSDVAQDGAGKLGKEALHEIEPGAVLGRESEFEAAGGLLDEPSFGFLGNVRGMIVEDQLDRRVGWIGGVEKLEEFDEFAAAVAILDGLDVSRVFLRSTPSASEREHPVEGPPCARAVRRLQRELDR